MKVSIVTIVRNDSKSIASTIESVAAQTYPNCEYLIIDGASTDGTMDIIHQNEEAIDLIISEPDMGIYDAMNKGIAKATGEYIIFMNCGDRFSGRNVVQSFIEQLATSKQAAVYYGDALELDQNNQLRLKPSRNHKLIPYGMFTHHQSMFFKREAIADGYNTRYRLAGDFELVARLYKNGFTFQHMPLTVCIFQQGGLSQSEAENAREEVWIIQRNVLQMNLLTCISIRGVHRLALATRRRFPKLYEHIRLRKKTPLLP